MICIPSRHRSSFKPSRAHRRGDKRIDTYVVKCEARFRRNSLQLVAVVRSCIESRLFVHCKLNEGVGVARVEETLIDSHGFRETVFTTRLTRTPCARSTGHYLPLFEASAPSFCSPDIERTNLLLS